MTATPVGFAILGTGIIAEVHRQAIALSADVGARLVAVGHYDPSRFDQLGEAFRVPCLGYDELLARPDVDVVCLATPSGQHASQAVAAVRVGKHVLVETTNGKPGVIEKVDESTIRFRFPDPNFLLPTILSFNSPISGPSSNTTGTFGMNRSGIRGHRADGNWARPGQCCEFG